VIGSSYTAYRITIPFYGPLSSRKQPCFLTDKSREGLFSKDQYLDDEVVTMALL
jgi:hypothetical protein